MTIREISPQEGKKLVEAGWVLVDVRSPGEWAGVHAEGAINLPLGELTPETIGRLTGGKKQIVTICHLGGRSMKACEALREMPGVELASVAGGTERWEAEGLPVVKGRGVISIERQVRIGAGVLVFVGTLLGTTFHSGFLWIPIFVGAGLTFAGITDFCGMGMILAKMPWNQGQPNSCMR